MRFHEEYRYKCIKHAAKMLRSKFKVHKTLGLVDEKLQEVDAKSTDMVHQVLSEYSANGGSFAMYVKRRIKLSAKEKTLDVDGIQNNEYLRGLFDKIGMADLLNNSGILETYRVLKSEYGHNDFSLLSDSEKKLLAFNQTSDLIKVSFDYLIRNALLTDNEIIYLIQKYLELKGKKFYFFDKARIDEYCLDEDKQDARDYVDFVSFVRISTYFLVFTDSVFKKVTSNPNALYIYT
ncbi:MAG: hypothetical protein N3E37_04610, partial [Candidatus Micrarchaeota archaeon]|nr:hypothetical protein [Candidatus Micrarchaeota archaeon]